MEKIVNKNLEYLYFLFRIVFGFMFFTHGAQKLFGWFGSKGIVALFSLMGLAGVIEVVVGVLLIVGLFAKYAALLGVGEMIGALVVAHFPKGIWPWTNGGELALLYLAAFLAVIANGAGVLSFDKKRKK